MYSIMERRFFSYIDKIGINNYLTIIPLEDGLQVKLSDNECEYCKDGNGYWKVLPAGEFTETVNAGHTLSFRGNLTPKADIGVGTFTVNKYFNLKGNCMSLLYGDNAKENTYLQSYAFKSLFKGNDKLINAKDFVLLAQTLSSYCYYSMFYDCISMTSAPLLPAVNLGYASYNSMFCGCVSLIDAPELPAINIGIDCYGNMFGGCTSLTTAPKLPATTLKSYCYANMFNGCTSLTVAPDLPATTLEANCYHSMFNGCTSLTIAPDLPATVLYSSCYKQMFLGCTSLLKAPYLPSEILVNSCYQNMFMNCNKLSYAKIQATDISASNCISGCLSNVAPFGTLVRNKNATWSVALSGMPSGWEVITE